MTTATPDGIRRKELCRGAECDRRVPLAEDQNDQLSALAAIGGVSELIHGEPECGLLNIQGVAPREDPIDIQGDNERYPAYPFWH